LNPQVLKKYWTIQLTKNIAVREGIVFFKINIFANIKTGTDFYFNHSFWCKCNIKSIITSVLKDNKKITSSFQQNSIYGIQFHPEVYHSLEGGVLLKNFIVDICQCSQSWTPDSFVESTVEQLKAKIGTDKVILGLSGGVDSSVAAVLLHKAIGSNLHCIFVDNGLLRKNEFQSVLDSYKGLGLNVKGVDASSKFYDELKGLTDPELKRKAIGKVRFRKLCYSRGQ
jgi:GMP synthase (glutamine-hydrolysing)